MKVVAAQPSTAVEVGGVTDTELNGEVKVVETLDDGWQITDVTRVFWSIYHGGPLARVNIRLATGK